MSLKLATAAMGILLLLSELRPASGCTCIEEPDRVGQRRARVNRADIVFRGTPIRQEVLTPEQWKCVSPKEDVPESKPGCVTVGVLNQNCDFLYGVQIFVDQHSGDPASDGVHRAQWIRQPGTVTFCDLKSHVYRVTARAVTQSESQQIYLQEKTGATVIVPFPARAPDRHRTEFRVDHIEKGPVSKTATVETDDDVGGCGFGPFKKGRTYEVFASKRKPSGPYEVNLCDGTRAVEDGRK